MACLPSVMPASCWISWLRRSFSVVVDPLGGLAGDVEQVLGRGGALDAEPVAGALLEGDDPLVPREVGNRWSPSAASVMRMYFDPSSVSRAMSALARHGCRRRC